MIAPAEISCPETVVFAVDNMRNCLAFLRKDADESYGNKENLFTAFLSVSLPFLPSL